MFPPGRGNDKLNVGCKYVISLYGTSEVITAEGKEVCLREYEEENESQVWACQINKLNRFGMRNSATGFFLGRGDEQQGFSAFAKVHELWESLTFTRLSHGGYSLMVQTPDRGEQFWPVQRVDTGPRLKIGEPGSQFGLHQLENPIFRRFEWVIPRRLARSSAPYYDGEDSDQSINETSIGFLVRHGIKNIISLNSIELSSRERDRLRRAKITYSHIKAGEFTAPSQAQFDQIWNAYHTAGVTIVYCGYGDGRAGMAISAIQLFEGRALRDLDYRANGAQCPSQLAALDELNKRLQSAETTVDPVSTPDIEPPPYTAPEKEKGSKA
ncbi:hypothetical protein HOY80DRAFT_965187 [Tuber brumale]|nr:hypothetical protein HOY80DRAFT_965187 [Tuber brumale]